LRQNYENVTIKTMLNSRCRLVGGCLLLSIAGLFVPNQVLAQTQSAETVDEPKWEIGINALILTDKNKTATGDIDPFGYIVKRYVKSERGRQAIRFKFSPRLIWVPYDDLSATNNTLNVAIGYEWQQVFNRFAAFYGVEPFIQHYKSETKPKNAPIINSQREIKIGASIFLGGRCRIGKHWSASVESHLYYNYRDFRGEGSTARSYSANHEVSLTPLHAVYVHYHF
jgi:hypothetical protein